MPSAVAAASPEISAALEAMAAPHEGLRDFARLNIQPGTVAAVRLSIEQYDRRARLLTAAKTAIDALLSDGYPDLSARDIDAAVLADLQANAASIDTALALFGPITARSLRLAASPPVAK